MQENLQTWQKYKTSKKVLKKYTARSTSLKSLQMHGLVMSKIIKKNDWLGLRVYKMSQKLSFCALISLSEK